MATHNMFSAQSKEAYLAPLVGLPVNADSKGQSCVNCTSNDRYTVSHEVVESKSSTDPLVSNASGLIASKEHTEGQSEFTNFNEDNILHGCDQNTVLKSVVEPKGEERILSTGEHNNLGFEKRIKEVIQHERSKDIVDTSDVTYTSEGLKLQQSGDSKTDKYYLQRANVSVAQCFKKGETALSAIKPIVLGSSQEAMSSHPKGKFRHVPKKIVDVYVALLDYTPVECDPEAIPLKEGQEVEVIDSKKPH
ncbi:uncharacterized protein LOC106476078, partial [Limulus polyphemus]|uniref:Uncharacterized protein LOC106476078 n=1 Tax=Limulus polyphemus TaxID=6850 RepID=A0ABM1C0P9_LIMPO